MKKILNAWAAIMILFHYSQNDPNAMNMQINATKPASYGATENIYPNLNNPFNQQQANNFTANAPMADNIAPNPGNPFAFPNAIQEETVQPFATDAYMHGTVEDRSFRQY